MKYCTSFCLDIYEKYKRNLDLLLTLSNTIFLAFCKTITPIQQSFQNLEWYILAFCHLNNMCNSSVDKQSWKVLTTQ